MKSLHVICLLTWLAFLIANPPAAAGASLKAVDDLIRDGERAIARGDVTDGLEKYRRAKELLQAYQKEKPVASEAEVSARLHRINTVLSLRTEEPAPAAPPEGTAERVRFLELSNQQYQAQLNQIHAENARLKDQLREALALRPAAKEPALVATTEAELDAALKTVATLTGKVEWLEAELKGIPNPEQARLNAQILQATRENLNQVVMEAEQLRTANEALRRQVTAGGESTGNDVETLRRELLVVRTAQRLAEEDLARLREENSRLHTQVAALEGRLSPSPPSGSASVSERPRISQVDLARLALAQGDPAESERLLKGFLDTSPESTEALYLMGRTLLLLGRTDEAEIRLKKLVALSPNSGVAHFELARLYLATDATKNGGLIRWHYHKALNLGFPRSPEFEQLIRWEQPGG